MLTNVIYVLIASILIFVLYLAVKAITRGVEAKSDLNEEKKVEFDEKTKDNSLTIEIDKVQKLYKEGVLTEEEFKKAKQKILDN
ncbi:MAG: hypothetical protein CMI86_00205 [Candidatus Pelagibacter sp.]|nr:hypothetical protein [Candidatus Pelagibacter sp.]